MGKAPHWVTFYFEHHSVFFYSPASQDLFKESSNSDAMLVGTVVDLEFCHERSCGTAAGAA
jgi:hypothetical protein